MGMYAKVRRLYFRERLSINEIKRQTSLSRNTVKKWIKQADGVDPKYVRPKAIGKIAPYESRLQLALQSDAHRPKRDRRTALMLFKECQKAGFTGIAFSQNPLCDKVNNLRYTEFRGKESVS